MLGAHGNALLGLGRADEAYERYREAYELDPSDWEWQRGLARTAPEQAIPLLEARRAETGDEGDLLGALADAYAGAGRRDEALALYQQALDAGGGDEWYPRMGRIDGERALAGLEQRVRDEPRGRRGLGRPGRPPARAGQPGGGARRLRPGPHAERHEPRLRDPLPADWATDPAAIPDFPVTPRPSRAVFA